MIQRAANNDVVIRVNDLRKTFDGKKVLDGVSFILHRGETLAILGRSGQGKSVLIKCVVRLLWPDAGIISVLDQDVLNLEEKALNKLRIRIGYLFQEGALYDSMTLTENLMFPLNRHKHGLSMDAKEDLVTETLRSVDLLDARDKMPAELSGGMRKRAGLARTLVLQPEIILYDEPTTGLDPYTARDINELIVRIQEIYYVSSIVVTHDLKCTRRVADRIVILQNGNFIARGSYEELENHEDEMIRNYFI
jgi:phospholipid/cholesterol/gamma-HCH transport system ATP-binding protein